MDDLTATAVSLMIRDQFMAYRENEAFMEELKNGLLQGCSEKDSEEEIYAAMIINSMEIAAKISVNIITEILLNSGVIAPFDEKRLRKMILSSVHTTQGK